MDRKGMLRNGVLFGGVIALVFLASGVLSAQEAGPAASTVQDKLESVTDEQRAGFGIVTTRWVNATSTLPAYAFILGCHDCAGAEYDTAGNLVNASDLNKIPTSYILRVPENWNGKLVIHIPGGVFNQTAFQPYLQTLLKEGYALAVMDHPAPGDPSFPYDHFVNPPYSTRDFANNYFSTGQSIKDLVSDVFGVPQGTYGFGNSRGVLRGLGLLADKKSSPFDGYLFASGVDGTQANMEAYIKSLKGDKKVPLTCLPIRSSLTNNDRLISAFIGLADPEFRDLVLSGQASPLDYNVSERPFQVQKSWAELELGGDIQKKTIILQGLRDRNSWPEGSLGYPDKIVQAGKSDNMRLYLFKDIAHVGGVDTPNMPAALLVDGIHKLDAWVQEDEEPGALNESPFMPSLQQSCHALGFQDDPYGCFDHVFFNMTGGYYPDSQPPC